MDIRKPLKDKMQIKRLGEEWRWLSFKYECLILFYFICKKLGHMNRFCEVFFNSPDGNIMQQFSSELQPLPRQNMTMISERWLRNELPNNLLGERVRDVEERKYEDGRCNQSPTRKGNNMPMYGKMGEVEQSLGFITEKIKDD